MRQAKTIVLVVDNYFPRIGGAELVYQRLAEGLAAKGFRVSVVTTAVSGLVQVTTNGVRIDRMVRNRHLFAIVAFFQLLRTHRDADIIQTSTYSAAFPAWLIAVLFRKPVILLVHEVLGRNWYKGLPWWQAFIYDCLERLMLALPFNHYVAVSDYTYQQLSGRGKPASRIKRIYNGVDWPEPSERKQPTDKDLGLDISRFTFLYFGRVGYTKGIDLLLSAARRLKTELAEAQYLFVTGESVHDDLEADLTQFIDEFGERAVRRKTLAKPILQSIIRSADCVVIPSYSEGFGLSAVESSLLEAPMVVSNGGALPETVWGSVNFFKAGDAESLAQAMRRAYAGDFDTYPQRNQFSWPQMVGEYVDLYEGLT